MSDDPVDRQAPSQFAFNLLTPLKDVHSLDMSLEYFKTPLQLLSILRKRRQLHQCSEDPDQSLEHRSKGTSTQTQVHLSNNGASCTQKQLGKERLVRQSIIHHGNQGAPAHAGAAQRLWRCATTTFKASKTLISSVWYT